MADMSIPNRRSQQPAPSTTPTLQYEQWFRTMRQAAPVWRDPASGVWHVFLYDDAVAVMHDFHAFSSHCGDAGISAGDLISMDPPHHDQLRGLVSEVFTPRAIAQLEPRIRAITDELLDQTESKTEIELIDDLAYPLPITVIGEMLGVPAADRPFFKRWSEQLHQRTQIEMASEASRGESAQLMLEFHDYLLGHVQARRQQARNDLL